MLRSVAVLFVVVVVVSAGCKGAAAEACGAYVKSFDPDHATTETAALGKSLLEQHGGAGAAACDEVRLLLAWQERESERESERATRLAAGLARPGTPVAPEVKQTLHSCVETCRADVVGDFGCMTACGCERGRVELIPETDTLAGNFTCAAGAPRTCGDRCESKESITARDAAGAACDKKCTRELALAIGEAERAADVAAQQACCATVKGTWTDNACVAARPMWFAVCMKTRGQRSQPSPQECCTECGGATTATGCNTSRESDRCFVGCLKTLPR